MVFIFGAAYQGMEEYAHAQFGAENIASVTPDGKCDFTTGALTNLERLTLACVRRGESSVEHFAALRDQWKDSVLIGLDFSCGLVPMDAETRAWREENGRLNSYLSSVSDHTIRMFCGIGQVLK